jgi:SAM-dependent methyltransferase
MSATSEIAAGERFPFGENWGRFLQTLDEDRIERATQALADMLGVSDLRGKRFLDAGSGSGLSSLAAVRLGADVVSFDFDDDSVACTRELARRHGSDASWVIHQGSVLDRDFLEGLGDFDVVYSWGVLHHTGSMWDACDAVATRTRPGGLLFVALYNDQGAMSRVWTVVKRRYNEAGPAGQRVLVAGSAGFLAARRGSARLLRRVMGGGSGTPEYDRGMDARTDIVDWVGGYPFEVASPGEVFAFYRERGYSLERMLTVVNGHGCNEFVFRLQPSGRG